MLNKENVSWIVALLEQAQTKTTDKAKIDKLQYLVEYMTRLIEHQPEITIDKELIEQTNKVILEMGEIAKEYSEATDLADIRQYDMFKKQLAGKLEYLSTYKERFSTESTYLDEYLKKEFRTVILQELVENKRDANNKPITPTYANKLVEIDTRYLVLKEKINVITNLASKVKEKYDFYIRLWQMIFQSVSTASKEKYASINSNNT